MTTIPPATKLRVYLTTCAAWVCAAGWLVGCVVVDAPMRIGVGAALAVALLGVAVGFVKHEMELDLIRARSGRPPRVGADDDWEKGEA